MLRCFCHFVSARKAFQGQKKKYNKKVCKVLLQQEKKEDKGIFGWRDVMIKWRKAESEFMFVLVQLADCAEA